MLSIAAALAVVTTAVAYSHLKLVKWSLNADEPDVRQGHVRLLHQLAKWGIGSILAAALARPAGGAIAAAVSWTINAAGGVLA